MQLVCLEPCEPRRHFAGDLLFIRGADRSGGFIEATNDTQRTEQLADINNASTSAGNHGWKQLADLLRTNGYTVTQIKEPLESGAPSAGQTTGAAIRFETMDLTPYEAIVMASNNAVYGSASINALEAYVRGGGGVMFISDGNFGSNWRDSPNSDTQFLSRFGLSANQDHGTYSLKRSAGDFVSANHPVLFGVDEFDGEGVSPIVVPSTAPAGVTITRVAGARGTTWNNNGTSAGNLYQGSSRAVNSRDASLVLANAGAGRLIGHFDRNTFFNTNGAGTDITRFDNRQLALNLFNWVSDNAAPAIVSSSFTQSTRVLRFRLDDNLNGSFTRSDIRLRNRKTGENLPSSAWSLNLAEGNGFTDAAITIRSAAPLGPYQLRIERRMLSDDSGNVRSGAIRYNFTIVAGNSPSGALRRASGEAVTEDRRDWLLSLFADEPIINA
ncbi:MAG: hypothetical protein H7144_00280 [Burkholderiales bacterium]|nr:hypothetical protein [Phycisphaerae bacterium]